MQVDIINKTADFEALEPQWNAIYDLDEEAQFFLSWKWIAQIFRRYQNDVRILAVRPAEQERGDGYVAFFPLRFRTRYDKNKSCFNTEIRMAGSHFWSDYMGFVCHPEYEEPAITSLAESLKDFSWSCVAFKNMYISERRLSFLLSPFQSPAFKIEDRQRRSEKDDIDLLLCLHLVLPGEYESYLQEKLSANMRQKVRRFDRKVNNSEELLISESTEESFEHNIQLLVELWKKKWASRKGSDIDRLARKYRQILDHARKAGLLYLPVLWRGAEPLGALASFIDHQKKSLLFFVAGRDESANDPPPGIVLHAHSIRWAINNGLRAYDFLRGDEPYKYSFGAENRRLKFINIRTASETNPNGKLDSPCIDEVINLSAKYRRRGRTREAIVGYRQILSSNPDHEEAQKQCARIYYEDREFDQARILYQQIVERKPNVAAHWLRLGRTLFALNDFVEAEQALRRGIDLRSEPSASNHYYLGCALEALNLRKEALVQYRLAAQSPPGSSSAKRNIRRSVEKIRALENHPSEQ